MNGPQVSVVLPVYQGMPHLPEAVNSFLAQVGVEAELVLGDDGSTDSSLEWIATLNDPRIRFIPGASGQGLFAHLNRLIPHCRAPWIRFLCQDDVLEPESLRVEQQFIEANPSVSATLLKSSTIDIGSRELGRSRLDDLPQVLAPMLAVQQLYYHGCIAGNLSAIGIRASELRRLGGFDSSLRVAGDYALLAAVAQRCAIGVVPTHLVRVRSHSGQLSRAQAMAPVFIHENAQVRARLHAHLPPSAQAEALRYTHRRHGTLALHQAIRLVLKADFNGALGCLRPLGWRGSLKAFWYWLTTLNNQLRPQAPWVLPEAGTPA